MSGIVQAFTKSTCSRALNIITCHRLTYFANYKFLKINYMEVIVIESEAFYSLMEKVLLRLNTQQVDHTRNNQNYIADEWISIHDAQKLLPFRSKTTWQNLRDRGEIVFSQMGRKILYSRSSILEFIKSNEVNQNNIR